MYAVTAIRTQTGASRGLRRAGRAAQSRGGCAEQGALRRAGRAAQSRGLQGCAWRRTDRPPWLPGGSTPGPHSDEEEKLGGTAHEGDGLLLPEEVTERLGGYGGGIRDVDEGQVTEEEIHGGVEV